MKTKTTIAGFVLGLSLVGGAMGCVEDDGKPDESDVKGGPEGKAEAWGINDTPALFSNSLEYKLDALPRQGEARNIPWASSYWPVYEDSINHKWAGASSESVSAKYGRAFGVSGVEDAVSRYHGIDAQSSRTACTTDADCDSKFAEACAKREGQSSGRCIPTWWGICHAWAPAAILFPEPKHAVTYNGVDFKVNDIKALLTLVHDRTETKFVSLRCNQLDSNQEVAFDKYGRPTGGSASCKDTNPGTFHVLMANYFGIQGESFVYDRTWDYEVWNQPMRGYRVTSAAEVTALEANKLIGVTPEGGTTTTKTGNVAGGQWAQVGSFPVTAGSNLTVEMTGTGDPDVYVKFGSQPSSSSYDCRPYESGAAETCNVAVPSGATTAFVAVNAYGTDAATYNLKIISGGTIPSTYVFNDKAKKLMKMHMDVDYITEAPSSQDGNLGSRIDNYTRQDRYDYILELDADGKIIGGEWIGTSKKQHPDFAWLPIRHGAASVAGGKITFANVKTIYDLSMADTNPPTGGSDKIVNESATVARGAWKQYGPFNVAAGATFKADMTGNGDADLYVRKGAAPTAASYDCRPYSSSSTETCSIVGPATVYVGVNGYAASSSVQVVINYREGTGGGTTPVPPPSTFAHLDQTGNVAQDELKMFSLDVVAGRKIFIRTFANVDIDLYVQFGAAPTTDSYLARGYTTSGNETVTYTPTSNGKLYIGVHGYAAGAFTVRTADQ